MQTPLGRILLERGLVTAAEVDRALREQQRCGSRLGDILVAQNSVGMLALCRAVAEHHGLPFVNLLEEPVDAALLRKAEMHEYLNLRVLPVRREGARVLIATSEPDEMTYYWAQMHYGDAYLLAVTSPYDIHAAVRRHFDPLLEEESRFLLYRTAPAQSARRTLQRDQAFGLGLLLAACAFGLLLWPVATLLALMTLLHALYAATMLAKLLIFRTGLPSAPKREPPIASAPPDEADLPVYTILVPMYREAEALPHLMRALGRLDYPASKLDIKLVLEADDDVTIAAALALKPAWNVEIVRVPPSEPRTKPKALNYALRFARGEYVTVYDAEDEPDPLQLKKAVRAFRALPGTVGCLQARLNYYNADDNLLSRWFAIEYAILFDALLPGLQALSIPIPLGGTSNHLALSELRSLGEWDPFNVTEDADLGVRLAARGLSTAVLDSRTMEEAPVHLGPWIRQRSRWIKGYMQTWLVHMRDPLKLLARLGLKSFLGLQFFIGLAWVTYLTAPLIWLLSAFAWANVGNAGSALFPPWLQPLAALNLLLHFAAHWLQAWRVLPLLPGYAQGRARFRLAAFLFPFYWVLHSVASYKALWQLLRYPHFWEKTTHGLAKRPVAAEADAREFTLTWPALPGNKPLSKQEKQEKGHESPELPQIRQEAR